MNQDIKKDARNPLVEQVDELQRISDSARKEKLGPAWEDDVKKFYTLEGLDSQSGPSFRPKVTIPQLQVLGLNESTDLTDNNPRVIITKRDGSGRDKAHETALMAHWNQQFWNNKILISNIWAFFAAIGYLQVGFDPLANRGQGQVWARMRNPKTVFPDPHAMCDEDLQWLILEDKPYLDRVLWSFPEKRGMFKSYAATQALPEESRPTMQFQPPPGPMSMIHGLPGQHTSQGNEKDGRVRVRYCFTRDSTMVPWKPKNNEEAQLVIRALGREPEKQLRYPNGRLIILADGCEEALFDGDNPTPFGMFPIVSFTGMPRLDSYFPPSPRIYSQGQQELAEKMLTQIYENMVRMNNGIILVKDDSNIQMEMFGGTPAEAHMVSANSQNPVTVVNPAAGFFNAQQLEMPKFLLDLQRQIQGFTPARLGEPTQGNVAKDLYGMSIYESQKLTRMRGRLMAESVQRFAELSFFSMAKFYTSNRQFPVFTDDATGPMLADWNPIAPDDQAKLDVFVDPASIRPVSQTAMKSLALPLAQMGALPIDETLKAVDWPAADEVARKVQTQQALAAIAAVTKKK